MEIILQEENCDQMKELINFALLPDKVNAINVKTVDHLLEERKS